MTKEERQTRALERRTKDIKIWTQSSLCEPPEGYEGTADEWSAYCLGKAAQAKKEVTTLQYKLEGYQREQQ